MEYNSSIYIALAGILSGAGLIILGGLYANNNDAMNAGLMMLIASAAYVAFKVSEDE